MTRFGTALVAFAALAAVQLSAAVAGDEGFERALSLASEGSHAEARRVLDPLLESEPVDPQARLLHGVLRVQEGRRGEAIAVFSGLARAYPDMFEAHNNLAVVYVEEGRLDEARAILSAILERRPDAIGYRNLGDIHLQLAQRALERSRELGGGTAGERGDGEDAGTGSAPTIDAASSDLGNWGSASPKPVGEPAAAQELPARLAVAPAGACVVTAEYSDISAVEEARQWLQSRGAEVTRVARGSRRTVKDYRVYLPPLESRSSAREKMRELQEKGVRDVAVLLSGALKNAVSLGIYAKEANAQRRMARLKTLGYAPVLEPNAGTLAAYTAIEARVNGSYDALSDAWASRFPGQIVRQVDCD